MFNSFEAKPILTEYDTRRIPKLIHRFLSNNRGWFIQLKAYK